MEEIIRYFGSEFEITANKAVLGKLKPPATAHPDTLLHHSNYVCKDTLIRLNVDEESEGGESEGGEQYQMTPGTVVSEGDNQDEQMSPGAVAEGTVISENSEGTWDAFDELMVTGMGAEDKLSFENDKAEFQMISAMLLKATQLGLNALLDEKIFNKACIFAYLRVVSNGTIDNIGSRMDWKRDHVRALNQHKPCRRVRVARELQLPMLYWPILWKFGVRS